MSFPDTIQGLGYEGHLLCIESCFSKERELWINRQKILKPDPHESDTHAASAGLEKDLLQMFVKIKIPETWRMKFDLTYDFYLIRISEQQTGLSGE